jgi:hypothetical protein
MKKKFSQQRSRKKFASLNITNQGSEQKLLGLAQGYNTKIETC